MYIKISTKEHLPTNRAEKRAAVDAIKVESGCTDCGLGGMPGIVYDFHHRDPATKRAAVARLVNEDKPWRFIVAEIAKCDVLCANCHRLTRLTQEVK